MLPTTTTTTTTTTTIIIIIIIIITSTTSNATIYYGILMFCYEKMSCNILLHGNDFIFKLINIYNIFKKPLTTSLHQILQM